MTIICSQEIPWPLTLGHGKTHWNWPMSQERSSRRGLTDTQPSIGLLWYYPEITLGSLPWSDQNLKFGMCLRCIWEDLKGHLVVNWERSMILMHRSCIFLYLHKYIWINVQYLRVQSVYIHHIINNMYYNTAGIITIFLHYVLCMIFRNNVDYMYKYSQTWKFPEQVRSCLVSMYS